MEAPLDLLDSPLGTITSQSLSVSIGDVVLAAAGTFGTSAVWPVANKAILAPIFLPESIIAKQLFWQNGGTVSGNVDIGLVTKYGDLIIAAGSTAQSGTNATQAVDITDTEIGPGIFYIGMAVDNTTGTFVRSTAAAALLRMAGVQEMAAAFALPGTITFANPAAAYLPLMGLTMHGVI